MGVFGIGVSLVWYAVYREPREVDLTADEKAYLSDGEVATTAERVTWADWKHLFAYRATWGMVMGFFGEVYMGWVYQSWLPGYLEIERHMSIPKTGWIAGSRSRSASSAASGRDGWPIPCRDGAFLRSTAAKFRW